MSLSLPLSSSDAHLAQSGSVRTLPLFFITCCQHPVHSKHLPPLLSQSLLSSISPAVSTPCTANTYHRFCHSLYCLQYHLLSAPRAQQTPTTASVTVSIVFNITCCQHPVHSKHLPPLLSQSLLSSISPVVSNPSTANTYHRFCHSLYCLQYHLLSAPRPQQTPTTASVTVSIVFNITCCQHLVHSKHLPPLLSQSPLSSISPAVSTPCTASLA